MMEYQEEIEGPPTPSPIPNTVPSNPKDVVVNVSTFVNGKPFGGAEITENGRRTGQRSNTFKIQH